MLTVFVIHWRLYQNMWQMWHGQITQKISRGYKFYFWQNLASKWKIIKVTPIILLSSPVTGFLYFGDSWHISFSEVLQLIWKFRRTHYLLSTDTDVLITHTYSDSQSKYSWAWSPMVAHTKLLMHTNTWSIDTPFILISLCMATDMCKLFTQKIPEIFEVLCVAIISFRN